MECWQVRHGESIFNETGHLVDVAREPVAP